MRFMKEFLSANTYNSNDITLTLTQLIFPKVMVRCVNRSNCCLSFWRTKITTRTPRTSVDRVARFHFKMPRLMLPVNATCYHPLTFAPGTVEIECICQKTSNNSAKYIIRVESEKVILVEEFIIQTPAFVKYYFRLLKLSIIIHLKFKFFYFKTPICALVICLNIIYSWRLLNHTRLIINSAVIF